MSKDEQRKRSICIIIHHTNDPKHFINNSTSSLYNTVYSHIAIVHYLSFLTKR